MTDTFVVLLVVLVLVLIWRGPKTVPEIGRLLGRGVRSARNEARNLRRGDDDEAPPQ